MNIHFARTLLAKLAAWSLDLLDDNGQLSTRQANSCKNKPYNFLNRPTIYHFPKVNMK